MTTKELFSRLSGYSQLDAAAVYFSSPTLFKCYQICVLTLDSRIYYYCLKLDDFPVLVKDLNVQSVMIDSFTRIEFDIQVKYFKAFYNRASQSQKDYINRCLLVSNLLKYIDDSSSK